MSDHGKKQSDLRRLMKLQREKQELDRIIGKTASSKEDLAGPSNASVVSKLASTVSLEKPRSILKGNSSFGSKSSMLIDSEEGSEKETKKPMELMKPKKSVRVSQPVENLLVTATTSSSVVAKPMMPASSKRSLSWNTGLNAKPPLHKRPRSLEPVKASHRRISWDNVFDYQPVVPPTVTLPTEDDPASIAGISTASPRTTKDDEIKKAFEISMQDNKVERASIVTPSPTTTEDTTTSMDGEASEHDAGINIEENKPKVAQTEQASYGDTVAKLRLEAAQKQQEKKHESSNRDISSAPA